ncbi:hypothetical protein ANCCAN_26802 [Ancylostoma caninum]|uniref:Uncharacterized protein n=1 Tax=Ancylostoma caninum TaxID=29170 RepID=A0A368F5P5_ANCCA|nr:hypothetical protein ANCCAN_26802 [Ancylostoma caninum]
MGTAILLGTLIPYHFEKNRVNTGVKSLDDCLNMLLGIRMLIGGVTAFILDNTVPGATREQRGFALKVEDDNICAEDDGYAPSPLVRRFLLRYPQLCKLPFLPSQRSLLVLATSSTSTSMA